MGITKHIPNTITSMNLLCGALGVIFAFKGSLDMAFYMMLAGAVCDFCDGLSARALKAYSPMGKELDSLADLITFGLLPSIMLHRRLIEGGVTAPKGFYANGILSGIKADFVYIFENLCNFCIFLVFFNLFCKLFKLNRIFKWKTSSVM